MFPKADVHPIIFEEICVKEDINDPEKVEDKLLRLERTYSRDDKYKYVTLNRYCIRKVISYICNILITQIMKNNI